MPYCVNCGVELNSSAKRCPLCDVEVVLPTALLEPATGNSLPQQRDAVTSAFDKKLWIQVVSVLMATPALICAVINAVLTSSSSEAAEMSTARSVGVSVTEALVSNSNVTDVVPSLMTTVSVSAGVTSAAVASVLI